jgi:hypothetical protein
MGSAPTSNQSFQRTPLLRSGTLAALGDAELHALEVIKVNVSAVLERLVVALFGGVTAGLVLLFFGGCLWFLALAVPGDAMSIPLTKWLLVYLPVSGAAVFAICALFAPERTADYFGSLTEKFWRSLKNSADDWP